ncbi:MAG: hypothetical protein FWG10_14205 [Eubacteriaceae bacterium]|nr:hypothetical protein [Eubacteriaceae bacterium]
MGVYSEYLNKLVSGSISVDELFEERKRQLENISKIRGREIIVYASDILGKNNSPNSIDPSDILPFNDQLSALTGNEIDIILQTPGGSAEVVEDLVKLVRSRFDRVGVIVPGAAYSAGTIFTMAADEILMSPESSLGPIDAQISQNGKWYSADAFLEGLEKIKREVARTGALDITYIPILQNISPGEIQHCENAQALARNLVKNWLKQYKFKYWDTHSSTGKPVTDEDKENRAEEIASALSNQSLWHSHNRSIKLEDLIGLKLQVTNYSLDTNLNDAITRYYTLLLMSLDINNIYKIYETAKSQIYKGLLPASEQLLMPE